MKIFNVMWTDRHSDTTVKPFLTLREAKEYAMASAISVCRFSEDLHEDPNPPPHWLYRVVYSVEGDSLIVTAHDVYPDFKHEEKEKIEIIDTKFKFVAYNPCKGTVYTEETGVVFCAKDAALVPTLLKYREACGVLGCGAEHIESIGLLIERVGAFQESVEKRIPDTDTPCEIERCIGGKV